MFAQEAGARRGYPSGGIGRRVLPAQSISQPVPPVSRAVLFFSLLFSIQSSFTVYRWPSGSSKRHQTFRLATHAVPVA